MEEVRRHEVSDMYLAAAYLAYGAKFIGVDRTDLRRQRFIFEGTVPFLVVTKDEVVLETLKNVSTEEFEIHYTAGRVWFPPSYPQCIKNIKAAVHSKVYD